MPPEPKFPSRRRLLSGFGTGGGYLTLMAAAMAGATERPYLPCLAMVLITGLSLFSLTLMLAVRWALRQSGRRMQLELASVFLLVTIAAVCLAAMRWLMQNTYDAPEAWDWATWIHVGIVTAVLLLLCAPSVLLLGDSILALAAWFVWRPWVRACLRRWFSR
jgi:hypothetical protein